MVKSPRNKFCRISNIFFFSFDFWEEEEEEEEEEGDLEEETWLSPISYSSRILNWIIFATFVKYIRIGTKLSLSIDVVTYFLDFFRKDYVNGSEWCLIMGATDKGEY